MGNHEVEAGATQPRWSRSWWTGIPPIPNHRKWASGLIPQSSRLALPLAGRGTALTLAAPARELQRQGAVGATGHDMPLTLRTVRADPGPLAQDADLTCAITYLPVVTRRLSGRQQVGRPGPVWGPLAAVGYAQQMGQDLGDWMRQTITSDLEEQAAAWDKQCVRVQLKYFAVVLPVTVLLSGFFFITVQYFFDVVTPLVSGELGYGQPGYYEYQVAKDQAIIVLAVLFVLIIAGFYLAHRWHTKMVRVLGPRPGGYPDKWQRWLGTVSDPGDVTGGVSRRGRRTKKELPNRNED